MKKTFKTTLVTVLTLFVSIVGLISVGFSSWVINLTDETAVGGSIVADSIIDLSGFEITNVSTFDYGVYSYGNSASFTGTVDITYTLTLTPFRFDTAVFNALKNGGSLTMYGKMNSSLEVFEKSDDAFVNLNSVKFNETNVTNTGSNNNNYLFSFSLSNVDLSIFEEDSDATEEQIQNYTETRILKFTFNNHMLAKDYIVLENDEQVHKTIFDNVFTLYISEGAFSV